MRYSHKKQVEHVSVEGEPFRVLVSTRSGLADRSYVIDQLNNAEKDGEGFNPALIRRQHRPDEVTLANDADDLKELYYDKSTQLAALRRAQAEYRALYQRKSAQWRSYRDAWFKEWRQANTRYQLHRVVKPVEKRRKVEYYRTIRVLRSDAETLGLLTEKGRELTDVQLGEILKDYKPSNVLALGSAKTTMHIRVKYIKEFTYWKRETVRVKLRSIPPSREAAKAARATFIAENPTPSWKNDADLRRAIDQVNRCRAKARKDWNRLLAIKSCGAIDTRPSLSCLAAVEWGMSHGLLTSTPLGDSHTAYMTYASTISEARIVCERIGPNRPWSYGSQRIFEFESTLKSTDVPTNFLSKEDLVRHASAKLHVTAPEDELERFDRAQISLDNLEVGDDELDAVDFNAFRSVAELKDFKLGRQSAKSFVKWMKGPGRGFKGTLASAASAYLMFQFAVKPTESDIRLLLKHTRQELIGCRRGLFQIATHLDLFNDGEVTIRKGLSSVYRLKNAIPPEGLDIPLDRIADMGLGLNEMFTTTTDLNLTFTWHRSVPWIEDSAVYVGTSLAVSPFGYPAAEQLDDETVNGYFVRHGPRYGLDDSRAFLFQRWANAEIRKAIDPSDVFNLVETLKLPKNAWELFPLSFVVDWIFNTGSVVRSLQSLLSKAASRLSPSSATWVSMPSRLILYVPEYRLEKKVTLIGPQLIAAPGSEPLYSQLLTGFERGFVQTRHVLTGVKAYDTKVRSYIRGPKGLPDYWHVLAPKFQVNLDTGKCVSLLAMLTSSL